MSYLQQKKWKIHFKTQTVKLLDGTIITRLYKECFCVGKTVVNQPFGNGVSSHHSRKMVMTLMTDYWVVAGHSHFSIKNWKKMDIRDREKKTNAELFTEKTSRKLWFMGNISVCIYILYIGLLRGLTLQISQCFCG